ncbi:MAG: hypothetical protein LCH73_15555 [Proteobacteria bacterium]|nr:hypothetical protein [Pseudomonadota bacterium]
MNLNPKPLAWHRPALALALCLFAATPLAAPGAHGPNGEHLDAPPSGTVAATGAPRLEAQSEHFELVARLEGGELSLLIDRYATNEPVLGAQVEVESGPRKAKATFHADLGDYAVDDPALLKQLSTPGAHPLVITIRAGDESDLLGGVLHVGTGQALAAAQDHRGWAWAGGGALLLGLLALGWRWLRRPVPCPLDGGQA